MNEQKFPKELLTNPPNERLEFFKNHTVTHPLFEEIFQDLLYAIQDVQPGTLIFLFGPSGVGKTTMLKLIEAVLTQQMLRRLEKDLNFLPVVRINSVASEAGNFDWKDFFQRLLAKLNDPLLEKKIDLEYLDTIYNQNARLLEKTGYTSPKTYRRAVENAINYLKPLVIMIDDAQHIGKVVSSRKLLDQLNVVKCLANDTDSIYVMSGTYELAPFLNLNDQVSRRSINTQFPRYKLENKGEQEMFINTLRSFQQYLPLE